MQHRQLWPDPKRIEPSAPIYQPADAITEVHFKVPKQARTFARQFGGRLIRGGEPPRISSADLLTHPAVHYGVPTIESAVSDSRQGLGKADDAILRADLLGALAIMLFPRQDIDGLDLDNRAVEGGAFALCTVLLILARAARLRRLRHLSPGTFVAHLPGAAVELIAIAGVLEAGQSLVHRNASVAHFLSNAVVIAAVAAVCAALAAFLAFPSRRDLARRMFGD